uniref:Uncharacterized protein n=1 Tax=Triticum urartu TaxID=4572 RepID=A0A8R7RDM5_TRIUA
MGALYFSEMRRWERRHPRRSGEEGNKAGERRRRLAGKRMIKHVNLEHKLMIYQGSGAAAGLENHISH